MNPALKILLRVRQEFQRLSRIPVKPCRIMKGQNEGLRSEKIRKLRFFPLFGDIAPGLCGSEQTLGSARYDNASS